MISFERSTPSAAYPPDAGPCSRRRPRTPGDRGRREERTTPVYEFIAPTGAATLQHRAEISRAVTRVPSEITGDAKDELSILPS
jgi:hypothetical protein